MNEQQSKELNSKIRGLIQEYGEDRARRIMQQYFRQPENLPAFAMLFRRHVPQYPPAFHRQIWRKFIEGLETGRNVAGAAPRGGAKSTVTDVVFGAWLHLNAIKKYTILVSDTFSQAVALGGDLKNELEENELLQWIYGYMAGDKWAEDAIEIWGIDENGKRVLSRMDFLGAGMSMRGRRWHGTRPQLVLIDDLENDELVRSKQRRNQLKDWLLKVVVPALDVNGQIFYIGTILHEEALLNKAVNNKDEFAGWLTFFYQAIIVDTNGERSVWPERWTLEHLHAVRDDPTYKGYMGINTFNQEMQNQPLDDRNAIIKRPWVDDYAFELLPLVEKYSRDGDTPRQALRRFLRQHIDFISGAVDPAISEKTTADFWAMATIGITKKCPICEGNPRGHILQLDMVRMRQSDPNKQVDMIFDQHEKWNYDQIRIEVVAFQQALFRLARTRGLETGIRPPLKPFKPDTDKTRRAIVHSANFSGGIVHLRKDHPLYNDFRAEVLQFPQGEHDDMFDGYMAAADPSFKPRGRTFKSKPQGF